MRKSSLALVLIASALLARPVAAQSVVPLPLVVHKWAKQAGKTLVWEAGLDYLEYKMFFPKIDASSHAGLARALDGLNASLASTGAAPLQACMFKTTLVIRRITQAPCGKPL